MTITKTQIKLIQEGLEQVFKRPSKVKYHRSFKTEVESIYVHVPVWISGGEMNLLNEYVKEKKISQSFFMKRSSTGITVFFA